MSQIVQSVHSDAQVDMSPALTRQNSQDVVIHNGNDYSLQNQKSIKPNLSLPKTLLLDPSHDEENCSPAVRNGRTHEESPPNVAKLVNGKHGDNIGNGKTLSMTAGISLLAKVNGDTYTESLRHINRHMTHCVGEKQTISELGPEVSAAPIMLHPLHSVQSESQALRTASCSILSACTGSQNALSVLPADGLEDPLCSSDVQISLTDIKKKQLAVEQRIEKLIKRLRMVQSVEACHHVTHQLALLVENQHKCLERVAVDSVKLDTMTCASGDASNLLHSDDIKNLSTSALVSLVQQLQNPQKGQRSTLSFKQKVQNPLHMAADVKRQINETTSVWRMHLNHARESLDSDATESSSGGETEDEDTVYKADPGLQHSKSSIRTRACWRWSRDRASVISRWTWLHAQVNDLEYRIRQHAEMHRQLRSSKTSTAGPTELSHMTEEASLVAARCVPLTPKKRHKIVRTSQIPLLSAKTKRPVLVMCQCGKAMRQCAICSGHHNYAQPIDLLLYSRPERIAQVDYGYHPVLSFNADVSPAIKLEEASSNPDNKKLTTFPMSAKLKTKKEKKSVMKLKKLHTKKSERRSSDSLPKVKKNKNFLFSDKGDYRFDPPKQIVVGRTLKRKYEKRKGLAGKRLRTNSMPHISDVDVVVDSSPLAQSAPSVDLSQARKMKKENPFDINNIVIPYHMAALTRVEKLQYKEIDTPRWRECIDDENGAPNDRTDFPDMSPVDVVHRRPTSGTEHMRSLLLPADEEEEHSTFPPRAYDNDFTGLSKTSSSSAASLCSLVAEVEEDISDERIIAQHCKCELQEKKRYLNFITANKRLRSQRSLRSGATTPDYLSPDPGGSGDNASLSVSHTESFLREELSGMGDRRRSSSFTAGPANRPRRDQSIDDSAFLSYWTPRSFPLSEAEERTLEPSWHPAISHSVCEAASEWKVVPTDEERAALVLKLSKA